MNSDVTVSNVQLVFQLLVSLPCVGIQPMGECLNNWREINPHIGVGGRPYYSSVLTMVDRMPHKDKVSKEKKSVQSQKWTFPISFTVLMRWSFTEID